MNPRDARAIGEASRWLHEAAKAAKCWPCGCLHGTLSGLAATVEALPEGGDPLREALSRVRARMRPQEYECLGCSECYPALAANALAQAYPQLETMQICPTDTPVERPGWPPLPGEYHVLRFHAPVAICTLTDGQLADRLVAGEPAGVAIVGKLQTENLGIERIVQNVLSNPHIRFLVLCGPDSVQRVGHRPGQSLLALAANGLNEDGRIVGAEGKRPVLRNIPRDAVEAFRRQVWVADLVGCVDVERILESVAECDASDPGPAGPFAGLAPVPRTTARPSDRLVLDPAGYLVILPDRVGHALVVEHYTNDGVLDHALEGRKPSDLWATAIKQGLVTRLDHAAYLGQELARAEQALQTGKSFVQDAAPGEESPEGPVPPPPNPT
jgi:tetrahydromethanopterin S-methyltransferase subunit A